MIRPRLAAGPLLALLLALFPAKATLAGDDETAVIERIVDLSRLTAAAARIEDAVVAQTEEGMKRDYPDIDPRAIEIVVEVTREALAPLGAEAVQRSVETMRASFTPEELRQVLAFYESAAGRKAVDVMGGLAADNMAWAETRALELLDDIGPEVERRLAAEGIEIR